MRIPLVQTPDRLLNQVQQNFKQAVEPALALIGSQTMVAQSAKAASGINGTLAKTTYPGAGTWLAWASYNAINLSGTSTAGFVLYGLSNQDGAFAGTGDYSGNKQSQYWPSGLSVLPLQVTTAPVLHVTAGPDPIYFIADFQVGLTLIGGLTWRFVRLA